MSAVKTTKASAKQMIVREFGMLPQFSPSPVTLSGANQITLPLEIELTSDTPFPVVEFTVKGLASGTTGTERLLSNIRSVTVVHSAFKDQNGQPRIYTLDTATLKDGGYLTAAWLSTLAGASDLSAVAVDPVVTGGESDANVSYEGAFALPMKFPPGTLTVTLNCQEATFAALKSATVTRAGYLICPRRQIDDKGVYMACDSRRIAGLSTFDFAKSADAFAVVGWNGTAADAGGILDRISSVNPNGMGMPAQVGNMTMSQVTNAVQYYQAKLDGSAKTLEMLITIDDVAPKINRQTPMSLSLFRYDLYY